MDNVGANEQELLSGNIRKTVWKYGIPCALITIINTLYNIVDQIFIGNKIGPLGNVATYEVNQTEKQIRSECRNLDALLSKKERTNV